MTERRGAHWTLCPSAMAPPWTLCPSAMALGRDFAAHHDRAGLEQRFQVGEDLRPAIRHRDDELRILALHAVGDRQLHRPARHWLQLHGAEAPALGLELRHELVA